MHFDVIVGNPPYQEMTGGGGVVAKANSIYPDFIQRAMDLSPRYLSMIIPARWYNDDSVKSANLRRRLFRHLRSLTDIVDSKVCFEDVLIAGGLCYFLWEIDYSGETDIHFIHEYKDEWLRRDLRECDNYIRYSILEQIANKVRAKTEVYFSDMCLESTPFGFETYERGSEAESDGDLILISSRGSEYIKYESVLKNQDQIYRYKVVTGYKTPGTDATTTKYARKVINEPRVMLPGQVCTQTYFVVGTFDTPEETENCLNYLKTKFARAMILTSLVGTTVTRRTYQNLPYLDFSREWTSDNLYNYFDLTGVEIFFIEELIRAI